MTVLTCSFFFLCLGLYLGFHLRSWFDLSPAPGPPCPKPVAHTTGAPRDLELERDLTSALVNLGCSRQKARKAAKAAASAGEFEPAFRVALREVVA